jgi:hypothetical protein
MRYELSHHEWDVINPMLPNKPVAFPVLTTARPKRHLLDLGLGRPLARPAGDFWSPHDLLQSLRSLAAGWRLDRIMDAPAAGHDARCR